MTDARVVSFTPRDEKTIKNSGLVAAFFTLLATGDLVYAVGSGVCTWLLVGMLCLIKRLAEAARDQTSDKS